MENNEVNQQDKVRRVSIKLLQDEIVKKAEEREKELREKEVTKEVTKTSLFPELEKAAKKQLETAEVREETKKKLLNDVLTHLPQK